MASRLAQLTIDADDVPVVAKFWADALGYRVVMGEDGSAKLYPPDTAPDDVATVWVQHTTDKKQGKNRAHPDLRPPGDDVDGEVERLIALGARRVDVGQSPDDPYVVLADPAGNEFCVLRREPRAI